MKDRHSLGAKTAWYTLIGNIVLTAAKAVIGFSSGSMVVLSDAAHSGSDALSTVFVILGLKIAQQPPDDKHPYGHSRAETIAAKLVAILLILVGGNFAYSAVRVIISGDYHSPGIGALWISIGSILSKEIMYQYTYRVGKRIESPALIADAWHHRSDALSSIAALIGVFFARMGFPIFDPIMTIVVAGIIIKVGWDIVASSIDELMDSQTDPETIHQIRELAISTQGVFSVRNLKVHRYGAEHHVDCTITVSPSIDVTEGHDLSHLVEERIRRGFPSVTHVDIHIEPHSSQSLSGH